MKNTTDRAGLKGLQRMNSSVPGKGRRLLLYREAGKKRAMFIN